MTFGKTPTTTTETPLATDQIYLNSAYPPNKGGNNPNHDFEVLEAGPVSTDDDGNRSVPASVYVKDGGDVTGGAKNDPAVTDYTQTATKMSFLKGLVKIWANVWDSVHGRIYVDGSGVTQPVSVGNFPSTQTVNGSVSVNTIANYAQEAGGNLDSIDTTASAIKTDTDALVTNTTGLATQATLAGVKTDLDSIKTDADALVTNTTGLATQATLASAKADLDTIVTNTNKIPASPATEGGHLATIDTSTAAMKTDLDTIVTNTTGLATQSTLAAAKTDLDTLAGIVSGGKGSIKSASSDIADLATLLTLAGTPTDANTINSLMGRLTKLRDLLTDTFGNSTAISAATTFGSIPLVSAIAANSSANLTNNSYQDTFIVQINVASAFVGTIGFYGLLPDGATLQQINAHQRGTATNGNSTAINTGSALEQTWEGSIASFKAIYVVCTAFTSGAASVQIGLTAANYAHAIINTVASNLTQLNGTAPQLDGGSSNRLGVSLYGKGSGAAGDTPLKVNSAGDQYVLGDFTEMASLSAGSLNADLVASVDVSAYKWWSLHVNTNAYVGTLTFQGSNDNSNWQSVEAINMSSTATIQTTTSATNVIYAGPAGFRYLRVRMTSYTSGTAQGTLELYTVPPPIHLVGAFSAQSGTWTMQPGNTPNTTPWLESIHDGTNKANVLPATSVSNAVGSQGALLTAGAFAEQASLSAASLNADLVASVDVSNYKWFSIQVTGTWTGTISFQGSNDNSNWQSLVVMAINGLNGNSSPVGSTSSNGMWERGISFRYLRIRMTSYTSGTANGTLELYTETPANAMQMWVNQEGGPWTVNTGPGTDLIPIASAAFTTTQTSVDQTNNSGRGVRVVLDVTNAGTGSITLEIDAKDAASGKYIALLTGAAVTTNSTNVYVVYPGLTPVANAVASDVLPKTWRIKVVANNANSVTYSVGASYLS